MAVALDLLTRVRNIHWGGAVFAIGDDHGYIWYSSMAFKDAEPVLEKVGQIGPDNETDISYVPPGVFYASSYARIDNVSTFILGGNAFVRTPFLNQVGAIWLSNNGKTWEKVWTGIEGRGPLEFVWDKATKQFYAWMLYSVPDSASSECWSSADGRSWSLISSIEGFAPNPEFESHCQYKYSGAAGGLAGKGLADGKFGFNPAGAGLLITVETLAPQFINTVTFFGGRWGRGGPATADPGTFEISVDNAVTWKFAGRVDQPPEGLGQTVINTAIAGHKGASV